MSCLVESLKIKMGWLQSCAYVCATLHSYGTDLKCLLDLLDIYQDRTNPSDYMPPVNTDSQMESSEMLSRPRLFFL